MCNIKFSFVATKNSEIDEKPLFEMLESLKHDKFKFLSEEIIIQKYVQCFEYINKFGIGMVIFPKLLESLQGTFSYEV